MKTSVHKTSVRNAITHLERRHILFVTEDDGHTPAFDEFQTGLFCIIQHFFTGNHGPAFLRLPLKRTNYVIKLLR